MVIFCTWPKLGGIGFFLLDGPWIYFYWVNFYFDTLKFISLTAVAETFVVFTFKYFYGF